MATLQLTRSRSIEIGRPSLPSRRARTGGPKRSSGRAVVGLDIEAGAISAALVRTADGLVVERAASAPLEPGVVRDGEVVDAAALTGALRTLFSEHSLPRRVRIGVANQRIVLRPLLLPVLVDPKEIEAAVRFQAAAELPMPVDQAVLDQIPLGIVETPDGPRMRVMVVAARRDTIERLLEVARSAGLRPEGVDLAAFAMIRALGAGAAGESGAPALQLAVGGVVNLAVVRDGECLFTRVLPGGLEAMAAELAERGALTVPEARAMLIGPQADRSAEAATVVDEGIRRIAGEVQTSLDFHLDSGETVQRVALTGPALGVDGFAEALAARLGIPVDAIDVRGADGLAAGRFAVAAGLAVEEIPA